MLFMPLGRPVAVCVVAMSLTICRSGSASGEQVIELGGARNITATVSESDGAYRISVEMLPVRAFDPTTNKALNLSKGRMYAVQALGKYLKASSLAIRGLEISDSGANDGSFHLLAVVQRSGVTTRAGTSDAREPHETAGNASRPPAETSTSQRHEIRMTADATAADFLNRKADYLDTIVRLQEVMTEEGMSLEGRSLTPDDFYDSIASVEERAEAAFKSLAKQIDDDKLLSDLLEREELRPALKKAHAEVLESLKAVVARFDELQEKKKKDKEKK